VDTVASSGLARDPDDPRIILDADQAFAYVVAMTVAERVWDEVVGAPLTIANHFPRTVEQRDTLTLLTDRFISAHFSLRALLSEIVAHPVFNLREPAAHCGSGPYALPRLLNPWTDNEVDPARRGNSVGDGVFAKSPRPLVRSLHQAMEWPAPVDFPDLADGDRQAALGFHLGSAESGFRGLHSEARLVWEDAYGHCSLTSDPDFLSHAIDAAETAGASVEDVVVLLKDRLLGEPWVDETERASLEQALGTPLADTRVRELEPRLRLICGAYVSSPQFLLGGLPPRDTRDVPKLTAEGQSYSAICDIVARRAELETPSFRVECGTDRLTVRL
jgi:hypothetical protein